MCRIGGASAPRQLPEVVSDAGGDDRPRSKARVSSPIPPPENPAEEPDLLGALVGGSVVGSSSDSGGRRRRSDRRVRRGVLTRWLGPRLGAVAEWILVIVGAIVLAVVVKAFLLQAFYIPSLSMYPTLDEGDRVLVNKASYRISDVERGDIVVFERPASETSSNIPDLIKRVVGLPGESVVIDGGSVYVDGALLDESYLPSGTVTSSANAPFKCTREAPCTVPAGEVWVMGDNRNDSKDSRYFGPIAESTIVGKAFVRVWPLGRFGLL